MHDSKATKQGAQLDTVILPADEEEMKKNCNTVQQQEENKKKKQNSYGCISRCDKNWTSEHRK